MHYVNLLSSSGKEENSEWLFYQQEIPLTAILTPPRTSSASSRVLAGLSSPAADPVPDHLQVPGHPGIDGPEQSVRRQHHLHASGLIQSAAYGPDFIGLGCQEALRMLPIQFHQLFHAVLQQITALVGGVSIPHLRYNACLLPLISHNQLLIDLLPYIFR